MESILTDASESDRMTRAHAFRLLLKHGRPIEVGDLARSSGVDVAELQRTLERLKQAGRIRSDSGGRLVGSAGLSVVPDRHRMRIGDRDFWTWCAYDILGIMGALKAEGMASSRSPAGGALIELEFRDGKPTPCGFVLFRTDDSFAACCINVYEEWCPNSNFFEEEAAAQHWAQQHRVSGHIFTLEQAAAQASAEWAPLLDSPAQ